MGGENLGDVLFMEDDPILAICLERSLIRLGFNAIKSGSLEEARELEAQHVLYAVILDNCVPEVRGGPERRYVGWKYALALKEANPDLRVALHTTIYEQRDIASLTSSGITYLEKPADDENIRSFLTD